MLLAARRIRMTRFANRTHTVVVVFTVLTVLFGSVAAASAQHPGVRGGVSINPDQFYVGGHFESGEIVDSLYFKPNLEVGFGDDLTALTFNFEFVYKFPARGDWTLYAGGGPALNVYSADDDTFTEGGLNALVGVEAGRGLFFELKLGALDSPEVKFGVGWTFR
jgi:hypothetical protein